MIVTEETIKSNLKKDQIQEVIDLFSYFLEQMPEITVDKNYNLIKNLSKGFDEPEDESDHSYIRNRFDVFMNLCVEPIDDEYDTPVYKTSS